jgi:hypothetical protein
MLLVVSVLNSSEWCFIFINLFSNPSLGFDILFLPEECLCVCIFFNNKNLIISGKTNGDSVTQTVIFPEGTPLTLNCTYQTSYSGFLFWYVQYLNKSPQLLLKSPVENQRTKHQGFQASHVKDDSSFHLQKYAVHKSDSVVYYCVLGHSEGTSWGAQQKPRGVQVVLGVGSLRRGQLWFLPK